MGGVYRLKHHLAGSQRDVGACKAVSDEGKKEMEAAVKHGLSNEEIRYNY